MESEIRRQNRHSHRVDSVNEQTPRLDMLRIVVTKFGAAPDPPTRRRSCPYRCHAHGCIHLEASQIEGRRELHAFRRFESDTSITDVDNPRGLMRGIRVQRARGCFAGPSPGRTIVRKLDRDPLEQFGRVDRFDKVKRTLPYRFALDHSVVGAIQHDGLHAGMVVPMPNREMQSIESSKPQVRDDEVWCVDAKRLDGGLKAGG